MPPFTPTFNVRETKKNVKEFIADNKIVFWNILKPLLPWIIGLNLLDTIITIFYFSDSENGFSLGNLITVYFYTCLIITWHRVVIYGPNNYITMNPFKPKRHELVYIGMGILLGLLTFIATILGGLTFMISPILAAILIFLVIISAYYLGYKFCFYFPAKATNSSITFKESYQLTTGYFWKFAGTMFMAPLKFILLLFGYMFLGLILSTIVAMVIPSTSIAHIVSFLFYVPLTIYFYPILYVFGVTVLSNYYQHAIQRKGISSSD